MLEEIARLNPGRTEELEKVPDMRRWQREVLGTELIAAGSAAA